LKGVLETDRRIKYRLFPDTNDSPTADSKYARKDAKGQWHYDAPEFSARKTDKWKLLHRHADPLMEKKNIGET
jgi:hypothetical protein